MDSLHLYRLPERADDLARQVLALLEDTTDELRALAEPLKAAPEGPISLVFTGQYNAGKSTLVKALTGRADIHIDSNVATSKVTAYTWGHVLLTDTPGVQSGTRGHDEMAETALRESDLIVFVVSVDLFDDACARHLRHVAHDLGKRPNMVVVVNKAGTLEADPQIRLDAVRGALGPGLPVPIVLTDARDHLDSLEEDDPQFATELLEQGNIGGLEEELNALAARSGTEGRLRRPFERIIAICAEALEAVEQEPEDALARAVLNRQRRLVMHSRRRLERQFDTRILDWKRSMDVLGERLADTLDALDDQADESRERAVEESESTFRSKAGGLVDRLVADLRHDAEQEASKATEELRELAGSPQVVRLSAEGLTDTIDTRSEPARVDHAPGSDGGRIQDLLRKIADQSRQMADWWGGGATTSTFSGTAGHKLVYETGKRLGKNFKPWEAVRYAEVVGKGAQMVSKAMPYVVVGIDLLQAVRADRAENAFIRAQQTRRREIADAVRRSANQIEGEVRAQLEQAMADFYGPALTTLEKQQSELDEAVRGRSDLCDELARVSRSAAEELKLLDRARRMDSEVSAEEIEQVTAR